jgi:DNA adenine methylase
MTTTTTITKPFLKWVGGKTQIIDTVLSLFPREIDNYYEPFLGGGSVLLGFLSLVKHAQIKMTGKVYASDVNKRLIGLYCAIQSNPEELIEEVARLNGEYLQITGTEVNRKASTIEEARTSQESYYYWVRKQYNALSGKGAGVSSIQVSAMFLFLNKTCFRGMYREGPNGFNIPFGNYKNPVILHEDHIREVSDLIQNVVFSVASFNVALEATSSNGAGADFVYMDPPYAPESDTSFVGYTNDGFSFADHDRLFQVCHRLTDEKPSTRVRVLMSNAAVSLVTSAFPAPKYTTMVISCRRAIHSKNPETRTNEVLIRNYASTGAGAGQTA